MGKQSSGTRAHFQSHCVDNISTRKLISNHHFPHLLGILVLQLSVMKLPANYVFCSLNNEASDTDDMRRGAAGESQTETLGGEGQVPEAGVAVQGTVQGAWKHSRSRSPEWRPGQETGQKQRDQAEWRDGQTQQRTGSVLLSKTSTGGQKGPRLQHNPQPSDSVSRHQRPQAGSEEEAEASQRGATASRSPGLPVG